MPPQIFTTVPRCKQFDEADVLRKAMELFWKKGFHATSIQDLVTHLGINRASLYDTYGGKNVLFEKSLKLYRNTYHSIMKEFLAQQDSVKSAFFNLFSNAVEESTCQQGFKGCFAVNTSSALMPEDDHIRIFLAQNNSDCIQIFTETLEKGVKSGEISPDKDLQAIATIFFTHYSGIQTIGKTSPNKAQMLGALNNLPTLLD